LKTAQYYRQQLKDAPRAIEYLKKRGLSGEIAKEFGIGYAPAGWQNLQEAFPDYNAKSLVAAGLVIQSDEGKRYDRFRDRIMFPIHDGSGRVIGFGGRVLDHGEPKYLNSPETPLFSKGRELYGLYQARPAIRTAGKVVVVEGYMDVVALAQHGVATLGTATTPTHAQKLLRMTDTVVYCFDGDAAGRRAAWRALENTLPVLTDGKNAQFLFLPDGEDPDDFIRRRGKAAFEEMVERALPLSDFLLAELANRHPPTSAEGRAALVNAGKAMLAQLSAPILSALLRQRFARVAGLPDAEMAALLPPPASAAPGRRKAQASAPRAAPSLVRGMIQCLLLEPMLARTIVVPKPANAGAEGAALTALVEWCEHGDAALTTQGVMQHFAGEPQESILVGALTAGVSDGLEGELLKVQLVEAVKRYWQNARKRGHADDPEAMAGELSPEEMERSRQRALARQPAGGGA